MILAVARAVVTLVLLGPFVGCFRLSTAATRRASATTADAAQFVIEDLHRFWVAYDAGGRNGDSVALQRLYLDEATPGLRNFITARSITSRSLVRMLTMYPDYFAALRPVSSAIANDDSVFGAVRHGYARIKMLYPDAFFPPVTLLIGRFSTGGTTGRAGMLLGMEFYGADANAPVRELSPFARENQLSLARDFAPLVTHELAHILQQDAGARAAGDGSTLLARALIEGGADFVAELAVGRASYARRFENWSPREREFWVAFQREMHGQDVRRWLYNQGVANANWPGDLGYFMGYRIAQAYYAQATDKALAFRELLAQRDPKAILRQSGYDGRGPAIPTTGTPVMSRTSGDP